MNKRLKHNLIVWLIYSVAIYIILIPCQLWIVSISISVLLGFLFGCLNEIITQLRDLNDKKSEYLKS